ncbi:MAG: DUF4445 domain-containing protein [Spirochaetales bacterium]|nr:DUF4445 domain-containing protein [Spirochaetales bacterium]
MTDCTVFFQPHNKAVIVPRGTTLLEAALKANITMNNLCGGDGICGRCKMIIKKGAIPEEVSGKLTREEIKKGYVLACLTQITQNLVIEIPSETIVKEKIVDDEDAERFREFGQLTFLKTEFQFSPLVRKIYINLDPPTLDNNTADHQRICEVVRKKTGFTSTQMGLKIIKNLPAILRENNYKVTATIGLRRDIAEIMDIEPGNTENRNYMVIVDIGTTTIVAHLIDANSIKTLSAKACFNSQGIYGREVTGRIISAEKRGDTELQKLLINDINGLVRGLAQEEKINFKDITAIVCAGNTVMSHFLLGLPTRYIRREPYTPISVEPPPLRAVEVGIQINPRGLLYSLPGISGWVGSDLTAGILATNIMEDDQISLLVDIGTNGEIIVGNKDWLVACSASAGPALEGANVACGIRAETGAIETVFEKNGKIQYKTIGFVPPKGFCGSGIIDIVSVLFSLGVINRQGRFFDRKDDHVQELDGEKVFLLVEKGKSHHGKPIYISESDIENIITAKAAIFAAMKILLLRLELTFHDISRFYIAGAFGNHINIENSINIGLIPDIDRKKILFAGNTSIKGGKLAAYSNNAFYKISEIREKTTYYDLMGADDYVDEFRKAMFLPHTDIELFQGVKTWHKV